MSVELPHLNVIYMPIPKAACTSVKFALAGLDPNRTLPMSYFSEDVSRLHKIYKTSRFRPHRWQPYCDGTWWRFTVIRDPLRRILSLYQNRVVEMRELFNSPRLRAQTRLPMDPDPDFFFQNLRDYMDHASVVKHHALPSRVFIGPRPFLFDDIYKVEELNALAERLSERAGQSVVIPRLNTTQTPLQFSDLSSKTQSALKLFLLEDYINLRDYYPIAF